MATPAALISFRARLHESSGGDAAAVILLPQDMSDQLPSRGLVAVKGSVGGVDLWTVAWPDGKGGHWLKLASGERPGGEVDVEISPVKEWPEPTVPNDLSAALGRSPEAMALWSKVSAAIRTDWIYWLDTSKRAETRAKRIEAACDMLAKGKKKVCCFDRSGIYSKAISCPVPSDED